MPKANSSQIPTGTVDPLYLVTSWVPSKSWNGTTYFGNSNTSEILEINMRGQVVWRYAFPHPNAPSVVFTGLMVLPKSNNVLFTIVEPESYRGAYEVSPQGQLVWSYVNKTISHDSVRLPNGDTLIDAAHSEDYGPWPYTYPEVFEVNQQGQVVWQWHASQDYQNSAKYAGVRSTDFGYWTHVNEALRLPDGNTMISVRNFNLTIIVDPSGNLLSSFDDPCGKSCGLLGHIVEPHSPVPLPNGNYLTNSPGPGKVYEFNPATKEAVWQWPPPGTPSTTPDLRGSQRLPNGNTLICDSGGQLLEVTPDGQTVWALRYANYKTGVGPQGAPFFQAERISYMSPGFALTGPTGKATYTTNTVPLSLTAGMDLGNVTYSIRNNSNGTWTVRNATLLQNVYKDSLDPPKTTNGPSSLNLANGNYTLRIFASSTGYGYKAFIQQKRINYATTDTTFIVAVPATTSTTTITPSSTTSTSSSSSSSSTTSS
ncbi:MAG: aryl-sulfate sulfotransferase, partial [Nitrososphaerales archaeon]|nr:aryl-sulfate sulfotransferase [Nitrososphaerales archaeon]